MTLHKEGMDIDFDQFIHPDEITQITEARTWGYFLAIQTNTFSVALIPDERISISKKNRFYCRATFMYPCFITPF